MSKLYMVKGLSGSGKTALALNMVETNPKLKRVNKDLLREMLHGGKWSWERERVVLQARDDLIHLFLQDGFDVISDDTNLSPKHEQRLREIATIHDAEFSVIDLTDVPYEECVRRDRERPHSVGEQVIREQWLKYICPPLRTPEPLLPWCVIVDLDGTLADISHRSPYNPSTCEKDGLREHVWAAVRGLIMYPNRPPTHLFAFSGRHDTYRPETERWLAKHGIDRHLSGLFMRQAGDNRKDAVIKKELFEQHIEGKYNVFAVVDDRPQVLRQWRMLGLPTIDVSEKMGVEF